VEAREVSVVGVRRKVGERVREVNVRVNLVSK
jgi:hypothetical protein